MPDNDPIRVHEVSDDELAAASPEYRKHREHLLRNALVDAIVLPADVGEERIVGLVIEVSDDSETATVVWFSNVRGVLRCVEATADLRICTVDESQADNVSRASVVDVLGILA